jgi:hypothetical protein
VLAGCEDELDTFTVALGRLGKGVHARSMILDGVRGVGKTVLLREFNYIAREHGWITSGVVECDEGEQLPRIVAKLCHRECGDRRHHGWSKGHAIASPKKVRLPARPAGIAIYRPATAWQRAQQATSSSTRSTPLLWDRSTLRR